MKRILGVVVLSAALALPAQGQIGDGATGWADYQGPSSGVVNTPFFQFDMEANGVFYDNWDFMCVDSQRYLTTSAFKMQLFALSNLPSTVLTNLSYSVDGLRKAAIVYGMIKENGWEGSRGAQYAAWFVNGTLRYDPDTLTGDEAYHFKYLTDEAGDRLAMWQRGDLAMSFSDYYLMVERTGDGTYNWSNQPQLTHYSVPEPGTLFLLGSGLFGVAYAARRRKEVEA